MKLHDLINHAYQNLLRALDNTRAILLHPKSRFRSVVIAKLLNDPSITAFYYAMGPDDIDLPAFINSMTHDLIIQHPTFGRHLNLLEEVTLQNSQNNFDLILNTFSREIAELSDESFILIFDEYDRSDPADDIQRFIERLTTILPEHCRIVINSRTLPRLPWVAMIAQKRAIMLEDDHIIARDFYGVDLERDGILEVYALGPGYVLLNGTIIDNWEGHLPRLLLFFTLNRPVVTRSEICQAFWPDLDPDQAVNVFHVTKRRLHKALDLDVLVHDEGYYRVNPEINVYYDVMEFVRMLMKARGSDNPQEIEAAWQRSSELYRGQFLHGHDDGWIVERRHDYVAGYIETLDHLSNIWLKRGRNEQALMLIKRAVDADPQNEALHRYLMTIFVQVGRRSEAVAHYQRLSAQLKHAGRQPEPDTRALYNEIIS